MTTMLVQGDESCFWLIEAASSTDVVMVGERAAMPFERVTGALLIETEAE